MFTFGLGPPRGYRGLGPGQMHPPRFRGNVRAIAYGASRRVGWPCLTCGRDRNRVAFAQVSPKREDLTRTDLGFHDSRSFFVCPVCPLVCSACARGSGARGRAACQKRGDWSRPAIETFPVWLRSAIYTGRSLAATPPSVSGFAVAMGLSRPADLIRTALSAIFPEASCRCAAISGSLWPALFTAIAAVAI
jgi:hypothetical protein